MAELIFVVRCFLQTYKINYSLNDEIVNILEIF